MRTLSRLFVITCAATLGLSAAAQQPAPRTTPAQPDGAPKTVTDAEFVNKAASNGMYEVQAGKMATEKATRPEVKAFAEHMVQDHSKANDQLKAAAMKAGIPVPSTLLPQQEKQLENLKTAKNFDATYMNEQLKAHRNAVALFTAASNSVKDPGLRAFAEKTLPTLKSHLAHAEKTAAAVTGTKTSRR